MPAGGWAAADLNLPALWYQAIANCATGCEYPISGDQRPEQRDVSAVSHDSRKFTTKQLIHNGRKP
ncbi:hypothetical protein SAMN04487912_102397 [Arthrobacter sp. cf158]|nr:hypothetical protein SAMN04487912_102397 [Arthrobacter sp. cf158]